MRPRLRKIWLSVHSWLGLGFGAVLAAIGLSGSALVFEREILQALYRDLFVVEAQAALQPLSAVVESVRSYGDIAYIRFPAEPTDPFEIYLRGTGPDGGERILVHPYTAAVLGPAPDAIFRILFRFHRALLSGEAGELAVGLLGVSLIVSCVSGAVLWWPGGGRVFAALRIHWRAPWRRTLRDLHYSAGAILMPPLVLLAATGMGFEFRREFSALATSLGGHSFFQEVPPSAPSGNAAPSIDAMLDATRRIFPEGRVTYVVFPQGESGAFQFRAKLPAETHQNGRSAVWFDRYDGRVLSLRKALDMPMANVALDHLLYPVHTGVALGLAGRLAVFVAGLAPAGLLATGVAIWLARRRPRRIQPTRRGPAPSG